LVLSTSYPNCRLEHLLLAKQMLVRRLLKKGKSQKLHKVHEKTLENEATKEGDSVKEL
jgi:hypothetical protein